MNDPELIESFRELTTEAGTLHEKLPTDLSQTAPELVEKSMQERRESTMRLRELTYRIERDMQQLDDMKRIVRIKQGWNSSDLKTLESYKFECLRIRKEQNA